MRCNFSNIRNKRKDIVKLDRQEVSLNKSFRYLRSTIQRSGAIDKDIIHRLKNNNLKFKIAKDVKSLVWSSPLTLKKKIVTSKWRR